MKLSQSFIWDWQLRTFPKSWRRYIYQEFFRKINCETLIIFHNAKTTYTVLILYFNGSYFLYVRSSNELVSSIWKHENTRDTAHLIPC